MRLPLAMQLLNRLLVRLEDAAIAIIQLLRRRSHPLLIAPEVLRLLREIDQIRLHHALGAQCHEALITAVCRAAERTDHPIHGGADTPTTTICRLDDHTLPTPCMRLRGGSSLEPGSNRLITARQRITLRSRQATAIPTRHDPNCTIRVN